MPCRDAAWYHLQGYLAADNPEGGGFLTPLPPSIWPCWFPYTSRSSCLTSWQASSRNQEAEKTLSKTSCFLSELPWITTRPNKHQVQEDRSRWECTASTRSKNSNCIFQELSALEHLTEMAGFNSPLVEHRNLDTYLVLHSAWEFTTELLNQFSLYTSAKQGLISKASKETEMHCLFIYNWQQS